MTLLPEKFNKTLQNHKYQKGYTNRVLYLNKKNNEVEYFLPAYLRLVVKKISEFNYSQSKAKIIATLILTVCYDKLQGITYDQLEYLLKNKMSIDINGELIHLKQQNQKVVIKSNDPSKHFISYTYRDSIQIGLSSAVFLTPFEKIYGEFHVSLKTIQKIDIPFKSQWIKQKSNSKQHIASIKFNLMDDVKNPIENRFQYKDQRNEIGYYKLKTDNFGVQYYEKQYTKFQLSINFLKNTNFENKKCDRIKKSINLKQSNLKKINQKKKQLQQLKKQPKNYKIFQKITQKVKQLQQFKKQPEIDQILKKFTQKEKQLQQLKKYSDNYKIFQKFTQKEKQLQLFKKQFENYIIFKKIAQKEKQLQQFKKLPEIDKILKEITLKELQLKNLQQDKIKSWQNATFKFQFARLPFIQLVTIMVPLWILSILNLPIFFQELALGARISQIATIVLAFTAYLSGIRERIPPSSTLTFIQINIYCLLSTPLLCLLRSFIAYQDDPDGKNLDYLWKQDILFIICLIITMASFGIIAFIYFFHWLHNIQFSFFRKSVKETKFDQFFKPSDWFNIECDYEFNTNQSIHLQNQLLKLNSQNDKKRNQKTIHRQLTFQEGSNNKQQQTLEKAFSETTIDINNKEKED